MMQPRQTARLPSVLRGIGLLAIFRSNGFQEVGGSAADVLTSLAPLLGFPLAVALLLILAGLARDLATPMAAISMFLAPLVASEKLASLWRRDAEWGRFAAAYNWCQWPLALAALLAMAAGGVMVGLGVRPATASIAAMVAISVYQLALHWFLARHGLQVSGPRAVLVTLLSDGASALLLALFLILGGAADQVTNGSAG